MATMVRIEGRSDAAFSSGGQSQKPAMKEDTKMGLKSKATSDERE